MNNKHIFYVIIGSVVVLTLSLYIFTRPALINGLDFSNQGQIGDTIGGVTSPIIGIVGSVLIYITFVSQNKANTLQYQQNSFNMLLTLFKDLKDDYNNVTFYSKRYADGRAFQGRRAISVFIKVLPLKAESQTFINNSFFFEYLYLIGGVIILLDNIQQSELDTKEKKNIIRMLQFFYTSKIKEQLLIIIDLTKDAPLHNMFHQSLVAYNLKMETNIQEMFPTVV